MVYRLVSIMAGNHPSGTEQTRGNRLTGDDCDTVTKKTKRYVEDDFGQIEQSVKESFLDKTNNSMRLLTRLHSFFTISLANCTRFLC